METIILLIVLAVVLALIIIFSPTRRYAGLGVRNFLGAAEGKKSKSGKSKSKAKTKTSKKSNVDRKLGSKKLEYVYLGMEDGKNMRTIHDGQRKLLLSEIEFLTKYGDLAQTVVYVGAAEGRHCLILKKMFPDHKFILYDPARFHEEVFDCSDFEIHRELFTDEEAEKYKDQDVLLISDIRTRRKYASDKDKEDEIVKNMQQQKKWIDIIKPKMASLKLRLPFTPGSTEYFDGVVYTQPFAPVFSAETRLFTDGSKMRSYDHTDHEQRAFHHNIVTRQCWYAIPEAYKSHPGLDNCYDCAAQIQILEEYNDKHPDIIDIPSLLVEMDKLMKPLDRFGHGKTITKPECTKFHKDMLKLVSPKK